MLRNNIITAGFGLLGVYQLWQGQWLGSASSLLFYALAARQVAKFDRAPVAIMGRGEAAKPPPEPPKAPRKKRSG